MNKLRWGIMATGGIANKFAQALTDLEDAEILSVASRTQENADAFGNRWNIPRRYASYESLAADPDVEVIYIATPHSHHYENMLLCLGAGKHVLCEKPLTLTAWEASKCINLARQNGVFLMEAMWMRFFPLMTRVRQWVNEGKIGQVHMVQADLYERFDFDPSHRLYDPALGGGALLDLGIYPISFATMLLGIPDHVTSHAHLAPTGVDELDTMIFAYNNGIPALLSTSMKVNKPNEAFIAGTKGYIKVHEVFLLADRLTLHINGEEPQEMSFPFRSNGMIHEAEHVHECLRTGKLESSIMPLDESLQLMQLMDSLRCEWGVEYAADKR
jgi:predicted dehydrogenase